MAFSVLVGLEHTLWNVHDFATFDEANEPFLDVEVAEDLAQARASPEIDETERHSGRQRVDLALN